MRHSRIEHSLPVWSPARKDIHAPVLDQWHGIRAVRVHDPNGFSFEALADGKIGNAFAVGRVGGGKRAARGVSSKPFGSGLAIPDSTRTSAILISSRLVEKTIRLPSDETSNSASWP